ncbi:hypothetical protein ACSX1A_05720 [Pontibacter sp. MBLB2868]|uniref:hypothetical protein n=1 Tax=Pontibacter sp. MBLB2868 TaxID=3451555 RepID=UPI003F74B754
MKACSSYLRCSGNINFQQTFATAIDYGAVILPMFRLRHKAGFYGVVMDVVVLLIYYGGAPQLARFVVLLPELPVLRRKLWFKRPRGVFSTRECLW